MSPNTKNPLAAFLMISASALTVGPVAAQNLEPSTKASVESPAANDMLPAPRAALTDALGRTASLLADLNVAADAAKSAEMDFRQEATLQIAALEEERAFAFRRLNLMRAVAEAVHSAESEEIAVANALAVLRDRRGWYSGTKLHASVFAHFSPVALAAFRDVAPDNEEPAADIREELAAFENWYAETWGAAFWNLFENPMPDTPRVDF
jgi:hypothetical protein